jgi:hypothetical protein
MRQDLIVRRHFKKKASAKSGGWLAKEGPTTIKEAKVGVASRRKKEGQISFWFHQLLREVLYSSPIPSLLPHLDPQERSFRKDYMDSYRKRETI